MPLEATTPDFQLQPLLSGRAVALIAVTVLAVIVLRNRSDLVLTILAICLLSVSAMVGIISVLTAFWIHKRGEFKSLVSSFQVSAHATCDYTLSLCGVRLLPGYGATLKLTFPSPYMSSLVVSGRVTNNSIEWRVPLQFPHRGDWSAKTLTITIHDAFGLTSWRVCKDANLFPVVTVTAQTRNNQNLPHLLDGSETGEDLPLSGKRTGDYFDLRSYHPSDGIKRIVWSSFARGGELASRIPEPAVHITGNIDLYVYARTLDDDVTAAATNYLSQLEPFNAKWQLGCLGAGGRVVAQDIDRATELLTQTVWQSSVVNCQTDFSEFLDGVTINQQPGHTVIIFAQDTRVALPEEITLLESMGMMIESRGFTPKIVIAESANQSLSAALGERIGLHHKVSPIERITSLLVADKPEQLDLEPADTEKLAQVFSNRGWFVAHV